MNSFLFFIRETIDLSIIEFVKKKAKLLEVVAELDELILKYSVFQGGIFGIIIAELVELRDEFLADVAKLADVIQDLEELKKKFDDGTDNAVAKLVFYRLYKGKKEEIKNMFHKVTEPVELVIEAQDKFGNPAKIDGAPALSVNDAEFGAFGEDGKFNPSGKLGLVKFQAKADADLGEGVKEILAESEELELIAGDAEVLKITIK